MVKQFRANDAISPPLLWSFMCVCLRVTGFSRINRRSRMMKNSNDFKVANDFWMTCDKSMEAPRTASESIHQHPQKS